MSASPELKIYGLAAVEAFFARHPERIKRLYFDYATGRKVAKISSYLAAQKRIYRVVEPEELEKLADTVHHGGIVAAVEDAGPAAVTPDDLAAWAEKKLPVLVLDRIGNAHNLGAIVRTAAFFGVEHLVMSADSRQAGASGAAHRVAEGGMAHVTLHQVRDLPRFCADLAQRYEVVGAAAAGGAIAVSQWRKARAGDRDAGARPVAIVLGNEEDGLDPTVAKACTRLVTIPGTAQVESLNVSAAAAILMWEIWVDRPQRGR